MTALTRKRFAVRLTGFQPTRRVAVSPAAKVFSIAELAVCLAASIFLALWASSSEVLVGSTQRQAGTLLSCQYLSGARVIERQYFLATHEAGQGSCPLVKFN